MAEEGPQPASKKLEILRGFELERILDQGIWPVDHIVAWLTRMLIKSQMLER